MIGRTRTKRGSERRAEKLRRKNLFLAEQLKAAEREKEEILRAMAMMYDHGGGPGSEDYNAMKWWDGRELARPILARWRGERKRVGVDRFFGTCGEHGKYELPAGSVDRGDIPRDCPGCADR